MDPTLVRNNPTLIQHLRDIALARVTKDDDDAAKESENNPDLPQQPHIVGFTEQEQRCQQFGLLPLQHILRRAHQHRSGSATTSQLVHSVLTGGRCTVERPTAVLLRAAATHNSTSKMTTVVSPLTPASVAKVPAAAATTTTSQYHPATFINDNDNDQEDDRNANDLLPLSFFRSTALIPFPVPNYHQRQQQQQ